MEIRDPRLLRSFCLVCDLGSVSAAAQVLGYTQSAVSQQLAALERDAGVALVDRSERPLRPTGAGTAFRVHAERVLAAIAGADAALEDLARGHPRLRLAAFTSALSSFVPGAVRDLRRARPETTVQVAQLETREALVSLRAGEVDIAVVHHMAGAPVPGTAGLTRAPLLIDELFAVVPARHRLARREDVRVADLEGEPLILPRRDTPAGRFRAVVEHLFAQAGITPSVAYELDDLPAVQAFVAVGIGVVLMHGLTLPAVRDDLAVRRLVERPAGSRTVEAWLPGAGERTETAAALAQGLAAAARRWERARSGEIRRGP